MREISRNPTPVVACQGWWAAAPGGTRHKLVLALFAAGLLATPRADAAPEPSSKPVQPYVDLQTVGLPAVVHGRLVNYIFVAIRLKIAPGVDASRLQQGEPFIRDALIHASARTPFNPPDNGVRLDEARLKVEVLKEAQARFGPGKVSGVEVRSQTPQRRAGIPGASGLSLGPAPG